MTDHHVTAVDDFVSDLTISNSRAASAGDRPYVASGSDERLDGYLPIQDYAAIGDQRTLALVGIDGSIDWMCLPELDSPAVFASILDAPHGGRFSLRPTVPYRATREYLERTNVLRTTFETEDGAVQVTDALTIDDSQPAPWRELVRRVEGISGIVPMQWRCEPRFGFGDRAASWSGHGDGFLARDLRVQLGLLAWDAGKMSVDGGAVTGEFTVGMSEQSLLVLLASADQLLRLPSRADVERRLTATASVWRTWVTRHGYAGPWRDAVERSLLALRLLADGRKGAIAAAGTSSLPEVLDGKRNYDYRFAWVRDLSFTVDALLKVGMEQLPYDAMTWMLDAVTHTQPRVDPVYSLTGEVVRGQRPLSLSGYRGTTPVNVGNQAGSQLQLGGVGDLLHALWLTTNHGTALSPELGARVADIVDLLCMIWRREDAGLWELGDRAQYSTSKISCWVALDRALKLVESGQVPARKVRRWQQERDQVREFIEARLWSPRRNSYLFKADSDGLDCGVLLAARRGYLDGSSPRLNATIDAIRDELDAGDGLLFRYSGMQEQENAFLACSFWMVEALACAGRLDEADALMEQLVPLANDVGLYSEEIEPTTHTLRGNFPQALTHLALIGAAALLEERRG